MIPLRLELSNFLSYATPACLDFDAIHLACISGPNGAGKSTILDALTWALFGRSRFPARNEDDLVNRLARARGEAVEVRYAFRLEGVNYRVIRRKEVGKTAMLEFQIGSGDGEWRSMSEGRLRDTQAMIEQLLRMNFDTFINASFFLQGKADEFTTKTPNRRKEILAELLGVTNWDRYKESAAASRREADGELQRYQLQLDEIDRELAEEPQRREAVEHARQALAEVDARLALQEKLLAEVRRTEEAVKRQQQLVKSQEEGVARGRQQLARLQQSRDQRGQEQAALQAMLGRAEEIRANHTAYETAREQAGYWQAKADDHHGLLQEIRPHELAFERARATLAQRLEELEKQARQLAESQAQRSEVEKWLQEAVDGAEAAAGRLAELSETESLLNQGRAEHESLQAEQVRLDQEMRKMRERIDRLEDDPTGACPLCGQELTAQHRDEVIAELGSDGKALADRYRQNKGRLAELHDLTTRLSPAVKERPRLDAELRAQQKRIADLEARLREMDAATADWEKPVGGRLAPAEEKRQLAARLAKGDVEPQAQAALAELRERLAALGYDAAAHEAARGRLKALAAAPVELQQLQAAAGHAALLAETLRDLDRQVAEQADNLRAQEDQLQAARTELDELAAGHADARTIEDDAIRMREEKDAATQRLGAAQQRLEVLSDLRLERQRLCAAIEEQRVLIRRLRVLEKSCGPEGVPALLIEHARPEIEAEANELLDRLTGGRMTVRLETQRALKTRDHLAETLDIFVGDEVGERPYESFSGGEQFRINFAIRLALSRLLAKRAGARLQTLVIDEGFGSQDPDGRRRLVEAINVVQHDFELILVITHIEELRDAFPTRIEVEKGPGGSTVAVVN